MIWQEAAILAQAPECDVMTWPEVANNSLTLLAMVGLGLVVALMIKWFR